MIGAAPAGPILDIDRKPTLAVERAPASGQPTMTFLIKIDGVMVVTVGPERFASASRYLVLVCSKKHIGMTAIIEQKLAAGTHPSNASIPEDDTKLVVK